jgi:hypothetical protein
MAAFAQFSIIDWIDDLISLTLKLAGRTTRARTQPQDYVR